MAQTYRQYKKAAKKLGAKTIATRKEFAIIQGRLRKKYGKFKTVRTKTITRGLKQAGVTQQKIKRLRGR